MAKNVKSSKKSKLYALVVDDDATCRMVHGAILRIHEFQTYFVENGMRAVDLVRFGEIFDVSFMDIMSPEMNGVEVSYFITIYEDREIHIVLYY